MGGRHCAFRVEVHGPRHPFRLAALPANASTQCLAASEPSVSRERSCAAVSGSPVRATSGTKARSPERPSPFTSPCTIGVKGRPDWARAKRVKTPAPQGRTRAVLITSPQGHILIDGGLAESAPHIAASIRALGFKLEDVRAIVNSHVHYDHAGGIAALQRESGADVFASARSIRVLQTGAVGPDDPQYKSAFPIAPVKRVRALPTGDTVRVGDLALRALPTPGHTPGGTSWTWVSCEDGRCLSLVYGDSQTPVSDDDFYFSRTTTYPTALADFAAGFGILEQVSCDILLTPHPDASGMWERVARQSAGDSEAMRDPSGVAGTPLRPGNGWPSGSKRSGRRRRAPADVSILRRRSRSVGAAAIEGAVARFAASCTARVEVRFTPARVGITKPSTKACTDRRASCRATTVRSPPPPSY